MKRVKRYLFLLFCVFAVLANKVQPAAAFQNPEKQLPRKILCPTPPGIMLHSADGVYGMRWLVRSIEKYGLQTMTYRQVSDLYQRGLCPPKNSILVSLDDLGTSWLRQEFTDMIAVFTDQGYVLTLGVVTGTETSPQSTEIWDYLKSLQAQGLEIASHSARHSLLNKLDDSDLQAESEDSYQMLCDRLERCPVTFILPFGRGSESKQVLKVLGEKYINIVSIAAPKIFAGDFLLFKRIPLVEQDDNPREPKLGAPFFIQAHTQESKLPSQTQPNNTEAQ